MNCGHGFCARYHDIDPTNPDVHESTQTVVDGLGHPGFPADQVIVQVSYRDGDAAPRLYVSAQAELSVTAAVEMQAAVRAAVLQMATITPSPVLAVAR